MARVSRPFLVPVVFAIPFLGWLLPLGAVVACGGGQEPDTASDAVETSAVPPKEPPSEEPPAAAASAPSKGDAEAEQLAAAEKDKEESAPVQREVLYKVTPEGLVVDVEGVRLKPKAEPVKKPNGGYGIRITVEAESIDDDTHVLSSPENGPLSFAVRLFDKGGAERAHFGDERVGDEQQFIMPGGPLTLTREWPSGAVKGPLWWGEKVTLHVGLWGLGRANEKTRPMKKFFIVEMVGGAKPQAVVSPPDVKP
jgi:hypothetical protein